MLSSLMGGNSDPHQLARGRMRNKMPALRQTLTGRFRSRHALLLGQIIAHIDYLDEAIIDVSKRIEELWPLSQRRLKDWSLFGASSGAPLR